MVILRPASWRPNEWRPADHYRQFFPDLLADDFRADVVADDFHPLLSSPPVAPDGPDGECIVYAVIFALVHTLPCLVAVTPTVDGTVRYTRLVRVEGDGVTPRTTHVVVPMAIPYVVDGIERGVEAFGGGSFALLIEADDPTASIVPGSLELDYDPARVALPPEAARWN